MRYMLTLMDVITMWIVNILVITFSVERLQTMLTILVLIATLIFTVIRIYMLISAGLNKKGDPHE